MQAMNFEDSSQRPPEAYYSYSDQEALQQRYTDGPGQKLLIDEKEQLVEMLFERIKEDLPGSHPNVHLSQARYRLWLALAALALITLLCALTILGVAFGHITSPGAPTLGYGLAVTVITIAIIYNICNKSLRPSSLKSNTQIPQKEERTTTAQVETKSSE